MADFKFDKKGWADLEKHLGQKFKKAEAEANKAADGKSTPEGKARVSKKCCVSMGSRTSIRPT